MASYCKAGEKPKVIYRFKGDTSEKNFITNISPIDVITHPEANPNLQDQIYAWNFSTNRNPRVTLEQMPFFAKGKLTSYRVDNVYNRTIVDGIEIAEWNCSFLDGDGIRISGRAVGNYPGDEPKLVKMLVPGKPHEDICQIEIKDITGKLLFSESGKCPCNYQVACEECPPGFIKCTHNKYPGYCCIPCEETGDRLKNIANKIGR